MHCVNFVVALWFILNINETIDAYNDDNVVDLSASKPVENLNQLRLWVTISAKKQFVEVSWKNAPSKQGDHIFLTMEDPKNFQKLQTLRVTPLASFKRDDNEESRGYVPFEGYTTTMKSHEQIEDGIESHSLPRTQTELKTQEHWTANDGSVAIVAAIKPALASQWFMTGVPFNFSLSQNINSHTSCYGYWASYVNATGHILAANCIRAYPRWMHEHLDTIGNLRFRDIFIPATHDSGSYRPNFNPLRQETIVTKYALTQDENIYTQLLHGVRYLDIRIGYYRNSKDLFYTNHGISRQRPLAEVVDQVKHFVLETNEIVIFGIKEFPVGFGKDLGVHRLLVHFLQERFENLIVHPSLTWNASLRDILYRRQNVILAYDKGEVVQEFPHTLFGSIEQRWGNVQNWSRLEEFLRRVNSFDTSRLSSRPVADMAELTPENWDVILDRQGGLRKMADNVNWRICQLYRDELGAFANIVAVDFIRGTYLVEIAIDWNKRKIVY